MPLPAPVPVPADPPPAQHAKRAQHTQHEHALTLHTSDLPRFYQALDAPDRKRAFRRYRSGGSEGLRAFFRARIRSPRRLTDTVDALEPFYTSIRGSVLAMHDNPLLARRIDRAIDRAAADLPDPVHLPITLVVGRASTAGTLTPDGLLLAAEFFTAGPDTALDTTGPWFPTAVRPLSALPNTAVHEWLHAQQLHCTPRSLLASALQEGVADFLAARHAPLDEPRPRTLWGEAHEAEAWADFEPVMHDASLLGWLYSGTAERPSDIGYFLGSRIAEAWWDAHPALSDSERTRALLDAHCDAPGFLAASGYPSSPGDSGLDP